MGEAGKKGTGAKHQRKCVNLAEHFPRYRIFWEANGTTRGHWHRSEWPWLMELRGRYGVVSPWGGEILQAVAYGKRIGSRLRELPCVRGVRGDEEAVIRFHVDGAEEVFAVLKPYRRRQVSDATRQHLRSIGSGSRLGGRHGVQRDFRWPGSTKKGRKACEAR